VTQTEQILTLARRFCIDNILSWTDYYKKTRTGNDIPYDYSKHDYNVFPRYQTSEAILRGIESLVGKTFDSIDQCKNEIKELGRTSQSHFTTGKLNGLQGKAIEDARQKFIDFIDDITVEQLDIVEPLPYRRTLIEREANAVRQELNRHWDFDGGYWEPLTSCSLKPFVFYDKENLTEEDFKKIKEIVLSCSDSRIYEISETRYDYEIDISEFEADCYEIIYTDKRFEWIIYGSHEGTIAFGGEWLLTELDKQLIDKLELKNKW
jgi:hypothetical protein